MRAWFTFVDHRVQAGGGEGGHLARPEFLLDQPCAVLLVHVRLCGARNCDYEVGAAVQVWSEHGTGTEVELRNRHPVRREEGPRRGVGVADAAGLPRGHRVRGEVVEIRRVRGKEPLLIELRDG